MLTTYYEVISVLVFRAPFFSKIKVYENVMNTLFYFRIMASSGSNLLFFNSRWNISDFSTCSKTCGGGIQIQSVTCIQEVRHGGNNIKRVEDSFCPQPPPITQQLCSVVDCPVL